jgi:hypothetical protein
MLNSRDNEATCNSRKELSERGFKQVLRRFDYVQGKAAESSPI